MIGKDITYIANDLQLICKTLGKPYADVRGVNEYTQHVIRVVDEIASLFIKEIGLTEDITNDKYFKNTQEFCAAYKPHIDAIYGLSQKVERLGEVTGVWQNRTPDYCSIASVFIGLELACGMYQHQTRLITDELGKRLSVKTQSWLPRTREIQRVTMDLAFYLPQIGKARIIPELVAPWHGSTARPIPMGQMFILLLPDVLDNMDALWEKREKDLDRGTEADSKRDVEARLRDAISAFLPVITDEELAVDPEVGKQDAQAGVRPGASRAQDDASTTQNDVFFNASGSSSQATRSQRLSQSLYCATATADVNPQNLEQPHSLPSKLSSDVTPTGDPVSCRAGVGAVAESDLSSPDNALKRKHSELDEINSKSDNCNLPNDARSLNPCKKTKRRAVPATERQRQLEIRERFERRLTEKHSREVARQHSQRQAGIGLKNADGLKSGRRIYGRRRWGVSYTGDFERLPSVMQYLKEWQTREMSLQSNDPAENRADGVSDGDDAVLLRQDLRRGVDPSSIPEFRFPTSLAMAKAMLANVDVNLPTIGPDDDMYFDDGELDAYLGDEHYQKARLELWNAKGYDKFVSKDTIYSQRAVEIAAEQNSRIANMVKAKPQRSEKLNSAKLAALMVSLDPILFGEAAYHWLFQESFRENSEDLQDIDPILRKEFGRSVAQAAMEAQDMLGDRVVGDYGDEYANKDEAESDSDTVAGEEKELDKPAHDGCNGATAYAHVYQEDDAFEVVGDLDDYRG